MDDTSTLPTLYSFRRCPYAIRARMALAYSGQAVVLREVVLRDRPNELYQSSEKGTVPVLVLPKGREVIDESWDVIQWALARHDPDSWRPAEDSREEKEMEALITQNDQVFKKHLDLYKYAERHPEETMDVYRDRGEAILRDLDGRLRGHSYLLSEKLSAADIALFPFIRQFAHVDKDWFFGTPYPRLQSWLTAHIESDLFKLVMKKYKQWTPGSEPIFFP
jgi:glutathione S-transferase